MCTEFAHVHIPHDDAHIERYGSKRTKAKVALTGYVIYAKKMILLVTGLIVFAVFRANSKSKNSDEDKNEL
jgi:hypothetical protein